MARMTNAQLVDENIRLRAQCDLLERQVAELSSQLEMTQRPVASRAARPDPRDFDAYAEYVAAERHYARERGIKVVSYKTLGQFHAARGAH